MLRFGAYPCFDFFWLLFFSIDFLLRSFYAEIQQNRGERKDEQQYKRDHVSTACAMKRRASRCDKGCRHKIEIADTEIRSKMLFSVKRKRERRGNCGGRTV